MSQKRNLDVGDWIMIGGAGLIGLHVAASVAFPKAKAVLGAVGSALSTTMEIGATSVAIGGPLYLGYRFAVARKAQEEVETVRLLPRTSTEFNPSAVRQLIGQLAGLRRSQLNRFLHGREWFRFTIVHHEEHGIAFYVTAPRDRIRTVSAAWQATYPEAEIHLVEGLPPMGGYFTYAIPYFRKGDMAGLPFRQLDKESPLIAVLSHMKNPGSWLDICFSAGSWRKLQKQISKAARITQVRQWADDPENRARKKSVYDRFSGREAAINATITLGSPDPEELQSMSIGLSTAFSGDNKVSFRGAWPFENSLPFPLPSRQFLLTSEELGTLVHLPPDHPSIKSVVRLEEGEQSLEEDELAEGIAIGRLKHPILPDRAVRIAISQLSRHWILSGKTGSGKSSTLLTIIDDMIDQWLENPKAPAFTKFDPAGETVLTIISRLLKKEKEGKKIPWEKVHYFYLGHSQYPIGLNLLHRDGRPDDQIAKEAASLIRFAYSSQAPKMERILENSLLTLMEDQRDHTILGIVPLLVDEEFRRRVLPKIEDLIVKEFWDMWEGEKNVSQTLDSLLNRLSPLRTNPAMRRMFGQKRWSLDIKKWMDEGHIVLFDCLNVPTDDLRLIAGTIITKYHHVAKMRGTGSRLHTLILDEAHLLQIPVLSKIIAEDRKFGLSLGLSTQYLGQFQDWLMDAVTENVGTILSCTQGDKSAARVSKMTNGIFQPEMLQALPERTVAVYTADKKDGKTYPITCLVESDPPVIYLHGEPVDHTNQFQVERAKKVAAEKGQELQKRDGRPAVLVDQEINAYLKTKTVLQEEKEKASGEINPDDLWR